MLQGMTGLEVHRCVTPANLGWKIVLTIPRELSEWIDALLAYDPAAWAAEVNKLYKLAYRWVESRFGKGCGGVVGMHYSGDSDPSIAHYHLNVYVFPGRRGEDGWIPLPGILERSELDGARESWKGLLNSAYNRAIKEVNINVGYCGGVGKLRHWLTYLMKHPLEDLWSGWQGAGPGYVKYRKGRQGQVIDLTRLDMKKVVARLPAREDHGEAYGAGMVPAHFKRVRWFGVFADGQRSKSMRELGLVGSEVKAEDDGTEAEGWERTGDVAMFAKFTNDGVMLRPFKHDNKGERVTERIYTLEGNEMRYVMEKAFLVPWSEADCRPKGVSIGKRKRWHEPGGERAGRSSAGQVERSSLKAEGH